MFWKRYLWSACLSSQKKKKKARIRKNRGKHIVTHHQPSQCPELSCWAQTHRAWAAPASRLRVHSLPWMTPHWYGRQCPGSGERTHLVQTYTWPLHWDAGSPSNEEAEGRVLCPGTGGHPFLPPVTSGALLGAQEGLRATVPTAQGHASVESHWPHQSRGPQAQQAAPTRLFPVRKMGTLFFCPRFLTGHGETTKRGFMHTVYD